MTPFSLSITAQPDDIDELGHVNNAVWVRWIQQVATAHWGAVAPEQAQQQFVWMVTRHEIDYRGNLAAGESVTGETWISERPRGARFNRNVRFIGSDGKILVEAVTTWALIDRRRKRPVRVPDELVTLFMGGRD